MGSFLIFSVKFGIFCNKFAYFVVFIVEGFKNIFIEIL